MNLEGIPLTAADLAEFIRYLVGGLMGFMAFIFVGDMGRGNISQMIRSVYGFPQWFVPVVGLCQGAICVLTFGEGGKYSRTALQLLALLMGGCTYTHMRRSAGKKDVSSPLTLLAFSILVPFLEGRGDVQPWALTQLGLAGVGWVVGEVVGATVCERPAVKEGGGGEAEAKEEKAAPSEGKKDK